MESGIREISVRPLVPGRSGRFDARPALASRAALRLVPVVADSAGVLLSFVLGFHTYHLLGFTKERRPLELYLGVAAVAVVVFLILYERLGLYRPRPSVLNIEEIRGVTRAVLIGSVLSLALSFYVRDANGTELSRMILTLSFCWLLLVANGIRLCLHRTLEALHERGVGSRRVLICGGGELGRALLRRLTGSPQLGLRPVGFLDDDPSLDGTRITGQTGKAHTEVPVIGGLDRIDEVLAGGSIDEVILSVTGIDQERVGRLVGSCEIHGVSFHFVPHLYGFLHQDLIFEDLDGIPLMHRRTFAERPLYEAAKRVFDLMFSALVVVLGAPLLVAVAILIRRDSPGPVLFVQDRVGRDGRRFRIFKFRTMYADTPAYELHPSSGEDPRLTPVGRWLRRFSLDELPQFLNVLAGDMSVVGPRPEMPFIADGYDELQRRRLTVKPGITGLWQISADRSRTIHENLDYDIFYVNERDFLLDMIIILETGFFVIRGVGAV